MKRVLVTGGAGYIGSLLVRQLLEKGYLVRVIDNLRFGGESLIEVLEHPRFEFIKADIRDEAAMQRALKDVWAVVHMAAIVGDPACAKEPELTKATNLAASKRLYALCEAAGLERFVFASTCSNYGKMPDPGGFVDETSPLRPVSLYAETKVAFEEFLLGQDPANQCKPTCLRFATVYGVSPRIRFDLTVNEFSKELALGRELVVFGEQFWRPYCHVRDLARSAVAVLEANPNKVAFEVFNVGATSENYQKQSIVELIKKELPEAKVRYVQKNEDPRDYRVRFEKIRECLGFELSRTVPEGIHEIIRLVQQGFILNPDDPKYFNVIAK
jgi:nucleoside-diphosphate-sugar epimerase